MEHIKSDADSLTQKAVPSKLVEGFWIADKRIFNIDYSKSIHDSSIDNLALSFRSQNALHRAGYHMFSDLLKISIDELSGIKNLGAKSIKETIVGVRKYLLEALGQKDAMTEDINKTVTEKRLPEKLTIDKIQLSVRASNAMKKSGYKYVHEIENYTYEDFLQIDNLGEKTAKELVEKVQAFLRDYQTENVLERITPEAIQNSAETAVKITYLLEEFRKECENCNATEIVKVSEELLQQVKNHNVLLIGAVREISDICKIPLISEAIEKTILAVLEKNRIEGVPYETIRLALPESLTDEILTEQFGVLTEKGVLCKNEDKYFIVYPSFSEILAKDADNRGAQFVIMRARGMTLEETAQAMGGLTRERARQIELKYMRKMFVQYGQMDEDKYAYIYKTYALNHYFMEKYLGFSAETVYFLEYKYKGFNNKLPIDETALDDSMLPVPIKKQIEKYILSQKIRIGNEYVEAKRYLVEEALFPILCKNTISAYDFIEQYNDFVTENQKPDLLITDDLYRSRINKYSSSPKILWTLNQRMRYYDTEAIDCTMLLEGLHLNQFHDIEISAKKLFDENNELMKDYDIHNEYELHNLLKKTATASDCPELELGRTPFLQFGNVDRKRQVLELLSQLTPISQIDFADAYAEQYGVLPGTVLANYLSYVKQYLNKDRVLEMDVPSLSDEQFSRLNIALTSDFYPMEQLLSIFRNEYPHESVEKINHYTLHRLGFHVYSGYVIRSSYHNAQDYFSTLLNSSDIVDANLFPTALINVQTFRTLLTTYLTEYELIEFLPKKYIRISRLAELFGTTKEDIRRFCQHVREFTDKQFFTIQSLRKDGFEDELFELGFDDLFYSSILFFDNEYFAHKKVGGNTVFKVGLQSFTMSDFVEWLLYREESMSMEAYELVDLLNETYGIRFDRYDIKNKILPGTQMYYSDITEKLYADYEIYFDEI